MLAPLSCAIDLAADRLCLSVVCPQATCLPPVDAVPRRPPPRIVPGRRRAEQGVGASRDPKCGPCRRDPRPGLGQFHCENAVPGRLVALCIDVFSLARGPDMMPKWQFGVKYGHPCQ